MSKVDQKAQLLQQARLLISRLERISVDSVWSRRSSGQRGALLRWIDRLEVINPASELSPEDLEALQSTLKSSFDFLENAAREYPEHL